MKTHFENIDFAQNLHNITNIMCLRDFVHHIQHIHSATCRARILFKETISQQAKGRTKARDGDVYRVSETHRT